MALSTIQYSVIPFLTVAVFAFISLLGYFIVCLVPKHIVVIVFYLFMLSCGGDDKHLN